MAAGSLFVGGSALVNKVSRFAKDLNPFSKVFKDLKVDITPRDIDDVLRPKFSLPGGFRWVDPNEIRFSQTTAGGGGRATKLRASMAKDGWKGDPIDVVETPDGLATLDNTRVAVAQELRMTEIPVRVHSADERLPQAMIDAERFGPSTTWGEALAFRTAQQHPRIGPSGTLTRPRMPR
jgi:hypothetical protein